MCDFILPVSGVHAGLDEQSILRSVGCLYTSSIPQTSQEYVSEYDAQVRWAQCGSDWRTCEKSMSLMEVKTKVKEIV